MQFVDHTGELGGFTTPFCECEVSGDPRADRSYEDAHVWCSRFFDWYNHEHRHSGIGLHVPADVHYGRAESLRRQRALVLDAAYAAHPERFVHKPPVPPRLPMVAWINGPKKVTATTQ